MAARLAAGDDSALTAVFDRYGALVNGIATHLVGRDAASDITQEVFLCLWDKPSAFDAERGSLRTFLAVLARRRSVDALRRAGRRSNRELRAQRYPTPAPDVAEAAIGILQADRLREAISHLPAEQARAVELAYFKGLTFKEVAVATGASEGTTKSRLRLALGKLARELAPTDGAGVNEWS